MIKIVPHGDCGWFYVTRDGDLLADVCGREMAALVADGLERRAESQRSISDWAAATFGPVSSNVRVAVRANEELAELLRALAADDASPKAAEEVADVFIVLYRLADRLGVDIHAEVDRKMAINRERQWRLDATGHGYHVREKQS